VKSHKIESVTRQRHEVIRRIVDEYIERGWHGRSSRRQQLIERHSHLMPELAEQLDLVDAILVTAPEDSDMGMHRRQRMSLLHHGVGLAEHEEALLAEMFPKYEFAEKVDSGGQGVVYRAIDRANGRNIAVKILLHAPLVSPDASNRFIREARLISRLRHPNIVTLYDSGVISGRPFLVMEYVDGMPLDDYLAFHQPSVASFMGMMIKICRSVAAIHEAGIVHRDLKPANILVDEKHEPRVLDFGLARSLVDDRPGSSNAVTLAGQVLGTLDFLAPEAISGDRPSDCRSDVYTLGVILFRMISGDLPIDRHAEPAVMALNIATQEPRRLSEVCSGTASGRRPTNGEIPSDLDVVVSKCLEKSPADRYASAAVLADELQCILDGEPIQAKAHSRLYVLGKLARKHKMAAVWVATVVAILLVCSIVAGSLWFMAVRERNYAQGLAAHNLELYDELLGTFYEEARGLPGGRRLLDRTTEYVDQNLASLTTRFGHRPEFSQATARVMERRGDNALVRGKSEAAAAFFRDALKVVEADVVGEPSESGQFAARCRLYRKLATAEPAGREQHFLRAIAVVSEDAWLEAGEVRHEWVTALLDFAEELRLASRFQEALEQLDQAARAIPEPDEAAFRTRSPDLSAAARMGAIRSACLHRLGRFEEAIAAIESSCELHARLSGSHPADMGLKFAHMKAVVQHGTLLANLDRGEEGEQRFTAALVISEQLSRADPSRTDWNHARVLVHERMCRRLIKRRDFEAAMAHARQKEEICNWMLSLMPDNALWLSDRAYTDRLYAQMAGYQEQWQSALTYARRELARRRRVRAIEPDNLDYTQNLCYTLDRCGMYSRRLGEIDASAAYYHEAYEIRRSYIGRSPEVFEFRMDRLRSLTNLVNCALERRTDAGNTEARQWLAAVHAELERLRIDYPDRLLERSLARFIELVADQETLLERRRQRAMQAADAIKPAAPSS